MGLNGPYGKGEKGLKRWPHPSPWSGPNWTREGGRTLPSFSFPLPFSYSHKERRSPTPGGSRTPPFPCWSRKREGRRRKKEGGAPSLVQFGLVHGEGCSHPLGSFSPFPYGPLRPNTNTRNSPVLQKIPELFGTFPMSEYSLPIY